MRSCRLTSLAVVLMAGHLAGAAEPWPADVPELWRKSATPAGKAIVARLRHVLGGNGETFPEKVSPATKGYPGPGKYQRHLIEEQGSLTIGHAAGYGPLYQLTGVDGKPALLPGEHVGCGSGVDQGSDSWPGRRTTNRCGQTSGNRHTRRRYASIVSRSGVPGLTPSPSSGPDVGLRRGADCGQAAPARPASSIATFIFRTMWKRSSKPVGPRPLLPAARNGRSLVRRWLDLDLRGRPTDVTPSFPLGNEPLERLDVIDNTLEVHPAAFHSTTMPPSGRRQRGEELQAHADQLRLMPVACLSHLSRRGPPRPPPRSAEDPRPNRSEAPSLQFRPARCRLATTSVMVETE